MVLRWMTSVVANCREPGSLMPGPIRPFFISAAMELAICKYIGVLLSFCICMMEFHGSMLCKIDKKRILDNLFNDLICSRPDRHARQQSVNQLLCVTKYCLCYVSL